MKVLIPVCVYCKSLIKVKDIFIDPINAVLLKYSCECQWIKTRTIYLPQYYDRLYYANYILNGPCPVHAKQKQKYYCNDCKKEFCEQCLKFHKGHYYLNHHFYNIETKCPAHKIKINDYCKSCGIGLCEKCKNKKIHKKHSIISFKELSLFLKNFYSK